MENDLPLIRNNGRYGVLGHWGKRSVRRFTKKKILLLGTLLSLSLIFAISHNGNIIPVVNAGDYNSSFSHTRTLIFGDTQFNGPSGHAGGSITFNSKVNATCINGICPGPGNTLVLPGLSVTSGDTIVVEIQNNGAYNAFSTTDSQGNSYTQKVFSLTGLGGLNGVSTHIYTTQTTTTGTDTITTTAVTQSWAETASDYSGAIGFGNTATQENDALGGATSGTSSVILTVSSSSFVLENYVVGGNGGVAPRISSGSSQTISNEYSLATGLVTS